MIKRDSPKEITPRQQAFLLALAWQKGYANVQDAYRALQEKCLNDEYGRRHPSTTVSQFLKSAEERGPEDITMADAQRMIPLLKAMGPNVAEMRFDEAWAEVELGGMVSERSAMNAANDAVRFLTRHRDVARCVVLVGLRDDKVRLTGSIPLDEAANMMAQALGDGQSSASS